MANVSALTIRPGDVVVADFPGVQETKRRPALVVSSSAYHDARPDAILAVLTGQVNTATSATDYVLRDWRTAGLHLPTAYRTFVITLPRQDILTVIGHVSDQDWREIKARIALAMAS